jgi:chromate transporter
VLIAAAAIGLALAWRTVPGPRPAASAARVSGRKTFAWGFALWLAPLLAVAATLGVDSIWGRAYLFFTKAALVTFGGAYAVLGYVTQHLVQQLGWLTAEQSVAGLALAETTPGPLIIVLQFMGFMAGWNQPAPLQPGTAAVLAALLATWATFLPSFVFIFLGAPHVERLAHDPRISGALAAITAAVVGVIGTLALLLARVVLFPQGLAAGLHWPAFAIALASYVLLARTRLGLHWVLAGAAIAGYAVAS